MFYGVSADVFDEALGFATFLVVLLWELDPVEAELKTRMTSHVMILISIRELFIVISDGSVLSLPISCQR